MKPLFQLALLALIPGFSFAQNWALFDQNPRNFKNQLTSEPVSRTIYAEAFDTLNGTISYSSYPRWITTYSSYPYIAETGNLLGDSIVCAPNGDYTFYFLPNYPPDYSDTEPDFVIRSLAEPGDTWTYSDTTSAQVVSKEEQLVFNTLDSVKTIALSNGQVIRLSKTYGLLQIGDFNVIGIEGANIGFQLPGSSDWYNWSEGDVYQYFQSGGSGITSSENAYKRWKKATVLAVNNGGLSYTLRLVAKTEHYHFSNLVSTHYSDTIISFFPSSVTQTTWPGYVPISGSCGYQQTTYSMSDSGLVMMSYPLIPPSCSGGISRTQTNIQGLGRVGYALNLSSFGYGSHESEMLIGYQKAGQPQQGEVLPASFYGLTDVNALVEAPGRLLIFPNPASEIIFVKFSEQPETARLEIIDFSGRVIRQVSDYSNASPLAIEGLETGVYHLRITRGNQPIRTGIFFLQRP